MIDRLQQVVDWPIAAVERKWAGLRSFAPDRLPVFVPIRTSPASSGVRGRAVRYSDIAGDRRAACGGASAPRPGGAIGEVDPAPFAPARFA